MPEENKNVVSMPTAKDGSQGWRCKVCGGQMHYGQPINFRRALDMLKVFMDKHQHQPD